MMATGTPKVLVAGIGNIFFGDDGFGVEVIARLREHDLPDGVTLMDVGIRGIHLTYELMNGYDAAILVDAAPRGEAPGTITVLEPDVDDAIAAARAAQEAGDMPLLDSHGMGPVNVLSVLSTVEADVDRVLLVACEPADCREGIGLSDPVAAAIATAVAEVCALVEELAGHHLASSHPPPRG